MAKYLLLIALVLFAWWWLRRPARPPAPPPDERAAERMVACAHCGLNQPLSESIEADGRYFCCEAHRQIAQGD